MLRRVHILSLLLILEALIAAAWSNAFGQAALADGLLGLTQPEIREKFGPPQGVEVYSWTLKRMQRYTLAEWEAVGARTHGLGMDIYFVKSRTIELRYSFHYLLDAAQSRFRPRIVCNSYTVEFDRPMPVRDLASEVPLLAKLNAGQAKCYRSKDPLVADELRCILPGASELAKSIRMLGFSMLGISKPKFEQWNVELRAKADAGKHSPFGPDRMLGQITIDTGSIEEIDQLVGRAYEATTNPFNQ
jgi:hypothetical protein